MLVPQLQTGFNPRTRDGCEYRDAQYYVDLIVSIHAPVMGAKAADGSDRVGKVVSIHAPVMGANT